MGRSACSYHCDDLWLALAVVSLCAFNVQCTGVSVVELVVTRLRHLCHCCSVLPFTISHGFRLIQILASSFNTDAVERSNS